MKVCMLSFDFLPNIGGVASHVYELSRYLVKLGFSVDLITYNRFNKKYFYNFNLHGINVYAFRNPYFETLPSKINGTALLLPILSFLIKKHIDRKYDIFHYHGLLSLDHYLIKFLKRLFSNIRVVWTNHTSGYLELYETGRLDIINKALNIPNIVIAPSKELAQKTWKKTKFEKRNVFYIPNGVDIYRFKPCSSCEKRLLRSKLGFSENDKVILSTRRFAKKNGVLFLVKAIPLVLRKIRNAKLLLIGDYNGPTKYSDKDLILEFIKKKKLENNVLWLGSVPNNEISKYYCLSDISVLPSLKEAVSISGLESLASGLPIVGTNVGGIPELVIDGKTGYLVKPANTEDLAEKIIKILSNEKQLNYMKQEARKRAVENFSWEVITKETIAVYEKLLK